MCKMVQLFSFLIPDDILTGSQKKTIHWGLISAYERLNHKTNPSVRKFVVQKKEAHVLIQWTFSLGFMLKVLCICLEKFLNLDHLHTAVLHFCWCFFWNSEAPGLKLTIGLLCTGLPIVLIKHAKAPRKNVFVPP